MWGKIVDLATDMRFKIGVVICGIIPLLSLVLPLFNIMTDEYEIVSFSAMQFRDIYIQYKPDSLEMFTMALFGPAITGTFVIALVLGLVAIGLCFVRKKVATIFVYVLSAISCYLPEIMLAMIIGVFEETSMMNETAMLVFLMWVTLMFPVIMAGIGLAAASKNYY